ncbi:transient receptor potential cation channel subfamily V member 1-like [Sarcophilus harrisii]|uniref:transient receptor potential cation channel subfamily V member 1-like n=1 Tax=Sarcophilus harrisii TaxID=9305 RepID=UPI001301A631|nr:transient receptor potential cation channel subfamily V member 1-like [Sarcophilus harrisii]
MSHLEKVRTPKCLTAAGGQGGQLKASPMGTGRADQPAWWAALCQVHRAHRALRALPCARHYSLRSAGSGAGVCCKLGGPLAVPVRRQHRLVPQLHRAFHGTHSPAAGDGGEPGVSWPSPKHESLEDLGAGVRLPVGRGNDSEDAWKLCSLWGLSWARWIVLPQSPASGAGSIQLPHYLGLKLTGIYTVVLQKMILHDVARFLLVYVVFLVGFASALSALSGPCPGPDHCPYDSVGNASGSLFKLTLGLGDLSGPEHSSFPGFFLFVLIIYVILTSVLLLNMLIALMSETATEVSSRNEKIWQVQRAITILDMERCLPMAWRQRLLRNKVLRDQKVGLTPSQEDDLRTCLRVNEEEWKKANVVVRGQFMGIHEDPSIFPGMEI